jgi:hypothetical protein
MGTINMGSAHTARLEWEGFKDLAPDANAALLNLSSVAANNGLDKTLLELVKLRVSQINALVSQAKNCIRWRHGAGQKASIRASGRLWPGPKR